MLRMPSKPPPLSRSLPVKAAWQRALSTAKACRALGKLFALARKAAFAFWDIPVPRRVARPQDLTLVLSVLLVFTLRDETVQCNGLRDGDSRSGMAATGAVAVPQRSTTLRLQHTGALARRLTR